MNYLQNIRTKKEITIKLVKCVPKYLIKSSPKKLFDTINEKIVHGKL